MERVKEPKGEFGSIRLHADMKQRIRWYATANERTFAAEVRVLLQEAIDARLKRGGTYVRG